MTELNLTVKNIKTLQTDDGYAWSASYYLDGKSIGTARNGGYGGPTETRGIDSNALKVLADYAAKTPPHNEYDFEQVESLLESAMWDEFYQRKAKRILKSKVVEQRGADIYDWKLPKGRTIDELIAHVTTKYPNSVILNNLPLNKATKLLFPSM